MSCSMLNTLKTLDTRTAQGILANLTLEMMPDPGVPSKVGRHVDAETRDRLLHELRIRLRLKRDDNSPKARALLYKALAEEISGLALAGSKIKEVKARVGQQGLLSPRLYRIDFSFPNFRIAAEKCGVTRAQAEDAIRHPDSFEHFKPELLGFDPERATSLFLKAQKDGGEFYQLLVLTKRHDDTLTVINAWRVYPSDVDLSRAETPLDVLRAFVESFGIEFKIGGVEKKLFMYERVAVKDKGEHIEVHFDPKIADGDQVVGQAFFEQKQGVLEVAVAFEIDYIVYAESLRRHGVRVAMKPPKKKASGDPAA